MTRNMKPFVFAAIAAWAVITAPSAQATLMQQTTLASSGNQQVYAGNVLSNDLINTGQATLASVVSANFSGLGSNDGPAILNDGTLGPDTGVSSGTGGAVDSDGVFSVTYTLDTTTNTAGYNLTEIRSFAAHADTRAGQKYNVLVDYVGGAVDFVQLGTTFVVNTPVGSNQATQLVLQDDANPGTSLFATNVAAIRFSITGGSPNQDVYREFDVVGTAATVPEPASFVLAGLGLVGLAGFGLRRRQ